MKNIPVELQELKQWHMWKDENGTKIPIRLGGGMAKSNDPSTWCGFEFACQSAQYYSGLAFEITEPYTGIDLDNCLDESGKLREWAVPIVTRLDGIAYAEISPSGNGIKFLTRARKPEGSRCTHKIGGDKQQIEVYDHCRFWTITGNVYARNLDIGDGQQAVDWICSEYLTPTEKPPRQTTRIIQPAHQTPLMDRAVSYLGNIPASGKGGRNNSAFSLAGHLFAMADDFGNRLSMDQVVDLARQWNSTNSEPLPDEELQRAVNSASRNGTPREEKRSQQIAIPAIDPAVNLSFLLGEIGDEKPQSKEPDNCKIEVPGLIGDLVKYNLANAHYPLPELALAGAIALMSSVVGGKVEYCGSRGNLYVMGLAPSGGGKDFSRKLNRKILRQAGHGHVCGPERIGSHAGVVSALAENWNTLFQIDEIGRLLATMTSASINPHLYNITTVLMQVYSSADDVWQGDAYGDRKKVKTLEYPNCVVYGSSVPDGFWESLSKENLTNGLIGRFLIFENPEYVDYQIPAGEPLPDSIVDRARQWLDHKTHGGNLAGVSRHDAANPQTVYADELATDRLHQHAMDISARRKSEPPVQAAVWSRHAEKTNKLALLFACSRWGEGLPWPTIRIKDADSAIRLNNWLTRRMLHRAGLHVAENQVEKDTLKVLRIVQERPGIKASELARAMRWLKARDRREILLSLQESGDIVCEEIQTEGRAAITYRAV